MRCGFFRDMDVACKSPDHGAFPSFFQRRTSSFHDRQIIHAYPQRDADSHQSDDISSNKSIMAARGGKSARWYLCQLLVVSDELSVRQDPTEQSQDKCP